MQQWVLATHATDTLGPCPSSTPTCCAVHAGLRSLRCWRWHCCRRSPTRLPPRAGKPAGPRCARRRAFESLPLTMTAQPAARALPHRPASTCRAALSVPRPSGPWECRRRLCTHRRHGPRLQSRRHNLRRRAAKPWRGATRNRAHHLLSPDALRAARAALQPAVRRAAISSAGSAASGHRE